MTELERTIADFRAFTAGKRYRTIYADPPWQFQNRTGKVAPEHKRLSRYSTMTVPEICRLPVAEAADEKSHLYLWVPNALLPDGRGVGFYFRNVTEILLFGIRGEKNRTLDPGRSQVNLIRAIKREHSRKPDEFISLIERCSPAPFLEMFARGGRRDWDMWGNQATEDYEPTWSTYANHTVAAKTEG